MNNKPWYTVCGNVINTTEKEQVKFLLSPYFGCYNFYYILNQESKYEQLLAKQFYGRFAESQLIAVLHENPTKALELLKVKLFILDKYPLNS